MQEHDTESGATAEGSGGQRGLVVIALVVGLVVGLGGAWLLGRGGDDGSSSTSGSQASSDLRAGDPDLDVELPEPDPLIDVADATTAEAGLRGYLAAESARDWEASYAFLPDGVQQDVFTTAAAWVNHHADIPTITGYRVDEVVVDDAAGEATASTLVAYEPKLDPVIGLVPARARVTWTLRVAEDGTWRVGEQQATPLQPGEDGIEPAVRAWVDARLACEDTSDLEEGIVGAPVLADALCDAEQPSVVELGPVGPLADSSETSTLVSEFGAEVFAWARTVQVEATTPFIAVLGPVGEDWKIVGVIRAV